MKKKKIEEYEKRTRKKCIEGKEQRNHEVNKVRRGEREK